VGFYLWYSKLMFLLFLSFWCIGFGGAYGFLFCFLGDFCLLICRICFFEICFFVLLYWFLSLVDLFSIFCLVVGFVHFRFFYTGVWFIFEEVFLQVLEYVSSWNLNAIGFFFFLWLFYGFCEILKVLVCNSMMCLLFYWVWKVGWGCDLFSVLQMCITLS
jgi:hypothetical protein